MRAPRPRKAIKQIWDSNSSLSLFPHQALLSRNLVLWQSIHYNGQHSSKPKLEPQNSCEPGASSRDKSRQKAEEAKANLVS